MANNIEKEPAREVKETEAKPVYLKIGRGSDATGLTLNSQIVGIIKDALSSATLTGDMATGGGTTGRTLKGNGQAKAIFEFIKLLEDKAD